MDQITTSLGISYLAGSQPKSLIDWNAQYEALTVENDWWFKAAVAVARWVRTSAIARATAPTPQLAHA
jgi:hypothetical protein